MQEGKSIQEVPKETCLIISRTKMARAMKIIPLELMKFVMQEQEYIVKKNLRHIV